MRQVIKCYTHTHTHTHTLTHFTFSSFLLLSHALHLPRSLAWSLVLMHKRMVSNTHDPHKLIIPVSQNWCEHPGEVITRERVKEEVIVLSPQSTTWIRGCTSKVDFRGNFILWYFGRAHTCMHGMTQSRVSLRMG